jgi:hypothetical protein
MEKRIKASFTFRGEPYEANVLIKTSDDGATFIVNLFDLGLNKLYPVSFTLTAKEGRFQSDKQMNDDVRELTDAIKNSIVSHPDNPYKFN